MKFKSLTILFTCLFFAGLFNNLSAKSNEKFELTQIFLVDTALWNVAGEIDKTISIRPNTFYFPIVKMTVAEKEDGLHIDAMAIDNSWERLFEKGDDYIGYFVRRGRLFVVNKAKDASFNFKTYFVKSRSRRIFSDEDVKIADTKKCPEWNYLIKGREFSLKGTSNLLLLDKKFK